MRVQKTNKLMQVSFEVKTKHETGLMNGCVVLFPVLSDLGAGASKGSIEKMLELLNQAEARERETLTTPESDADGDDDEKQTTDETDSNNSNSTSVVVDEHSEHIELATSHMAPLAILNSPQYDEDEEEENKQKEKEKDDDDDEADDITDRLVYPTSHMPPLAVLNAVEEVGEGENGNDDEVS